MNDCKNVYSNSIHYNNSPQHKTGTFLTPLLSSQRYSINTSTSQSIFLSTINLLHITNHVPINK
ncbi:hypothetical protein HPG69_017284 [Diceros bicornis minor]|uniref:Uncharacterized protein n=1 Tax=Diceros bicornis minor TaxID=77932 RepID=A0A7J7ED97_DICBM|nr:hypothetical protein HPG69_017284 [Diceros bicornis minor]